MRINTITAWIAVFIFNIVVISGIVSPVVSASSKSFTDTLLSTRKLGRLQKFLKKYDSPLLPESKKFIDVADVYDLDWRFLVAISGIESTFGKFIPYNSYNPFGYDDGRGVYSSFSESIEVVGKYLYDMKNKGLDTPEKLGPRYTPPNYRNWILAVNYFMNELDF